MDKNLRKTGIDLLGDVPWGTHLCQFYHSKEDLIDILVPYFKAGLENNEFCMWITAEPLGVEEAKAALKKTVKNLDSFIKKDQIEILDFAQWYIKSGSFNSDRVLKGWVKKEEYALEKGFDGLRLSGNTFWLEDKDWKDFTEYEAAVDSVIGNYRMLAICSYSLNKCSSSDVIDVVSNHKYSLIRKEGQWELIESAARIKAEEDLRKSEELFRCFMNSATEAYFFTDSELNCISINKAGLKYFPPGLGKEDVVGKNILDISPGLENTERYKQYLNVIKTGEPYSIDEVVPHLKFGDVILNFKTFKVGDGLGMIIADITKHKLAEEELKISEEKYRSLIESTEDLVCLVDEDGSYIFMNQKYSERFAVPIKKIVGRSYSEFHSKKETELFKKTVNSVTTSGRSITREHESKRDGKIFLRTYNPIKDDKGDVKTVTVISKDISQLKQVEKELKQSEQEIHKFAAYLQSAREKERVLIAGELHDDIGQALTALKMDIYFIKNKMPVSQKDIHKKIQSLEDLLDDSIKKLRKIYSDLRPGLLEHFGISEALKELVVVFQKQTGVKCSFSGDSEEMKIDENRSIALYRICQEALNNIKWHSLATKAEISLKRDGANVKLTVKDNGKGIKKEQIMSGQSFGLVGMRERAHYLSAKLKIIGQKNKGTTIGLEFLLQPKSPEVEKRSNT